MRNAGPAATASIAVAEQDKRFEVHASGTPTFVASNFGFPINVVQVASGAGLVR